jgi:hypothetical protein
MRRTPAVCVPALLFVGTTILAQAPPTAIKPWTENRQAIEDFLKTARIVRMQDVKVGVTHPHRVELEPGGPVREMAWKPITPGMYNGYYESYKSEVAAYEINKLLDLDMVPPTVERRHSGITGAAIMWVDGTKSFREVGGVPGTTAAKEGPPPAKMYAWNRQLMKAKMFDNLIANVDPNLGNWLFTSNWDLILIDHSRALTITKNLYHKMQQIDGPLWDRMTALTEAQVTAAVGQWLDKGQIRALLERRDKMQSEIQKMIKEKGEPAVIVRVAGTAAE